MAKTIQQALIGNDTKIVIFQWVHPLYASLFKQTVPEAITAFLEGKDFEDVIRTAVSLGGDCDTLTCIAGGMAEAFTACRMI